MNSMVEIDDVRVLCMRTMINMTMIMSMRTIMIMWWCYDDDRYDDNDDGYGYDDDDDVQVNMML